MVRFLRNLLLFEALIATVIVGVATALLVNRLAYYQEAAEKANMELMVSSLKSALRMRLSTMVTQGRAGEYAALARDNPMNWLEVKPANYLGERASPVDEESIKGHWYFDLQSHTLTYLPRYKMHFSRLDKRTGALQWQVVAMKEKNSAEDISSYVSSVRFELKTPYQWF